MFDPPEELHSHYEGALAGLLTNLGKSYGMLINGSEVTTPGTYPVANPADPEQILADFPLGTIVQAIRP